MQAAQAEAAAEQAAQAKASGGQDTALQEMQGRVAALEEELQAVLAAKRELASKLAAAEGLLESQARGSWGSAWILADGVESSQRPGWASPARACVWCLCAEVDKTGAAAGAPGSNPLSPATYQTFTPLQVDKWTALLQEREAAAEAGATAASDAQERLQAAEKKSAAAAEVCHRYRLEGVWGLGAPAAAAEVRPRFSPKPITNWYRSSPMYSLRRHPSPGSPTNASPRRGTPLRSLRCAESSRSGRQR